MKKTFSQKWFTPKKLLIYFGLLLLYSYLMVVFNDPLVEKDGPFIKKYPTGQIEMKGTVKNGKEDGVWEIFYETGELQVRGTYKNGIRDGSWKMFDEEGNLVKSETYKNGVPDDRFIVKDFIDVTSPTLPIVVDENTTWWGVREGVEENSMVYSYFITTVSKDLLDSNVIKEWKTTQKEFVTNFYCTQPDLTPMKENNIKIEYNYSDQEGVFLFSINTDNSLCYN